MIGYILLAYIGVKIGAPFWYYALICAGVLIKTGSAILKAAKGGE